jgi:hypothetical protein
MSNLSLQASVHCELPKPIACFVRESVLFDGDLSKNALLPCEIVTVSSYKGDAITFNILLENGAMFSYVPIHMLMMREGGSFDLPDLCYINCPSYQFSLHVFSVLLNKPVSAYFKRTKDWKSARYLWSIDWYTENELLHFLLLDSGQFAFLPSHKVKFSSDTTLNPYREMTSRWVV